MKNNDHKKFVLEKLKIQKTGTGNLKYLKLILLLNKMKMIEEKRPI